MSYLGQRQYHYPAIGVPSGWEEIAARYWPAPDGWISTMFLVSYGYLGQTLNGGIYDHDDWDHTWAVHPECEC